MHNFRYQKLVKILGGIVMFILTVVGSASELDEESVLLADHTGIELRSVGKEICSRQLLLVTQSELAGPLFYKCERFRSRIISDNLRSTLRKCPRDMKVKVFFRNQKQGTFNLHVAKEGHSMFRFSTSGYNPKLKEVILIKSPSFHDFAVQRMAPLEIEKHFPKLKLRELNIIDLEQNAREDKDAAFLLALKAENGKPIRRTDYRIYEKMYYLQGPHINSCDFDMDVMRHASELGNATASYLVSECLFSQADDLTGLKGSIKDSMIDLSSLKIEKRLELIFHTAKFMHSSRMFKDGFELASNIRYYGGKEILALVQSFVDSQPVNVSIPEITRFLIKNHIK